LNISDLSVAGTAAAPTAASRVLPHAKKGVPACKKFIAESVAAGFSTVGSHGTQFA
jgi:hypothetical protein